MSQSYALIGALKTALRANGLAYRDVARALDLSEASVKRLFAQGRFSLQRLEQVCLLLGMEISDLVYAMEAAQRHLTELSEAQEQELVADERRLLVAHLVLNGWQFADICQHYVFAQPELIGHLVYLDKLQLIDLLPMNRIKLRIAPNFTWRRNGPIQAFFLERLQEDFFASRFHKPCETLQIMSGALSKKSAALMIERLHDIEVLFVELNRRDRVLPLAERSNIGLVLAQRPWHASLFDKMLKQTQ